MSTISALDCVPSGNEGYIPTVAFVTLGCAKNEVDSDRMRARLAAAHIGLTDEPATADVVVVNTCSFLTAAVEEGVDTIFEVLGMEGFVERGGKVIVTGCMPARYGGSLAEELSEVAAFVPVSEEERIVRVICDVCGCPLPQDTYEVREVGADALDPGVRRTHLEDSMPIDPDDTHLFLRTTDTPSAYVKISDGCDRFCSFCTIPFIRGRYRSRASDAILHEIAGLVESGVCEVVLIGQDTGIWGHDLQGSPSLSSLLTVIAARFPRLWVRVLYLQPDGIDDDLLDVVASYDNIASYFDIPIQHADATILSDMNRTGSASEFHGLICHIRERVPGAIIRTTLIAGFPGETDEQFSSLVSFLEDARLDVVGVFAYSQEEGTRAGNRTDQVPLDVREERAQALRDIADSIGFSRTALHVGEEADVLIERYDDEDGDTGTEYLGRWMGQAPEVDGLVHIASTIRADGSCLCIGDLVRTRFVDSYCYDLVGEILA
jgi:ribosomal protein S12 methylthiotransferase